jgi:transcriptional regulator with AAA-type ATPase domain
MSVFTPSQRRFAEAVSQLTFCNPFLPERIAWERAALGDEFDERYAHWNLDPEGQLSPNIDRLTNRGETILTAVRDRVSSVRPLEESELQLYEDVLLFVLFHRFRDQIPGVATGRPAAEANRRIGKVYRETQREAEAYLTMDGRLRAISVTWPHAFAAFFQLCRAFDNISRFIIGISAPAVALRAAVWQSIFTHDMRRYGRVLFDRMADYTTLVMGPSGTGKELVARAVGLSRYVPFDAERQTFRADFAESFFPISLSAMSPTLIESELFGHQRGAFTGAVTDRAGWLEVCPPHGTVFLDEIGELDPAIQVKLLRVLQERTFSRLGETDTRRFDGKIVAATNRDLDDEMHAGRFRQDLYYRLCSDIIHVPSLKERIAADPGELHQLTLHLSQRLVGEEGPSLAAEVEAWIEQQLGADYEWPGNVRELEQCLRNVLIRKEYRPRQRRRQLPNDPLAEISTAIREGRWTADELLRWYCTRVYTQTGSYEAAARQLQLDRRTVKAKVDLTPPRTTATQNTDETLTKGS